MNNCVFCKIVNKEIPSEIIYEDKDILVFLDINPTTNGDTLVIPKKHYKDMFTTPKELLNHMNETYKNLYEIYKKKLKCDGLSLTTNMDYAQEIKHFHMHFIPRYINDEVKYLSNKEILKDIKDIEIIINN
ncbi:MAG: HIT domain-containing protein [Bacilli bacterium]|nr:HIT domain-containing protein [Bacilli bacterium]